MPRGPLWIVFIGALFAALFLSIDTLDLFVSHLFFSPENGFVYAENFIVRGIYQGVKVVSAGVIGGFSVLLFWRWRWQEKPLLLIKKPAPVMKVSLFLLLAFILGPGIVIHWGAKEFFERPRPRQVIEFGGDADYEAPFTIHPSSWKKTRGYSFPSGHASVGFYFTAFGLLAATRRKRIILYSSGILLGLIVGTGRILQGGHFLSDVIFAGVLICLINHLLYWVIFERKKAVPEEPSA